MLSKKNSMVTMVTDEFLENCIILSSLFSNEMHKKPHFIF